MPTLFQLWKKPLLALALGLAACTSEQATQVDRKPGVDLTRFKTYNFMDETARNDSAFQESNSPDIFELKRAVAHELEARGYQRTDQPDLLVNIGLRTQEQVQTRQANYQFDGPYYIGQRNYHWQANDIPVGTYEQGTATIDIVDAARKELVWQGTTTSILSRNTSRASKQIDKGVADVFAKFPVPARQ